MTKVNRNFVVTRLVVLASLFALAFASTVFAQPEPPRWVRLAIIDVKSDMVDEFLAVQKEMSAAAKERGVPFRALWATEQIGPTWRYIVASPMESLEELGATSQTDQTLIDRVVRCIDSRRSMIVTPMNDLSKPLPMGTTPNIAVVFMNRVSPGREADYTSWLKNDYFPHFDKVGVNYLSGNVGLGSPASYVHFILFPNFAEFAKGSPLNRSAGQEGADAVLAKRAGIVRGGDSMIMRYDTERSFDQRGAGSN